jgi:hypothetical protein
MTESKDLNCMRSNNVISGMDAHDGSQWMHMMAVNGGT